MIDHLNPYSDYKETGIPWLNKVPEHWEIRRIKNIFREKDERPGNNSGVLLSLTRNRGLIPHNQATDRIASAEDLSKYKVCSPGDLVMNRMQAWSGMFGVSPQNGLVSPDYSVFTLKVPSEVEYFLNLFKTTTYISQFANRSKGIGSGFNRLYTPDFGSITCLVPPIDEQTTIVRFLNYFDRLIKRYIRAKQKQIKLLEEQKQGIINQAVTRGLDPSVRVKHSGVEWLEEIPETWSIYRIRNAVNVIVSNVDKHIKDNEYPVRLCNYVDVYKNNRITNKVKFMTATALMEEIQQFRLQKNDVLITKDSEMWNDIGVPALVDYSADDLICGYHLAILRPKNNMIIGGYLFWLLQSNGISSQFYISANGVTRYGLSHAAIKNVIVPIPPLGEQQAISNYLDSVTTNYDRAIVTVRKEISLLKEYYERLIADVVTGRFDVQAAADHLPKEIKVIESVKEEEFSDEESEYQVELEVDLEEGET